ncbi:MAG: N-acetylmuramoyl-L-alanine amidase [Elusimicrobiota bacterium]|nr:N-acetylmuramoyl-L-alanine amidase [Elusimicrobiota bacterium]
MMKRILTCLFMAAALCAPAQARVDEVTYLKNGVYSGKIGTYSLSGAVYLDAAQAAKLIGGKIYWYPVSGKLLLQIKGKQVVFFMKSDSVVINDEGAEFPNPMIVRGGKAFLALNFFISKYFSEAFGFSLDYNPATGALAAQRAVNITSMNYFSHQDKTRIVVYLEEPLEWQASQKENNLFKITIFGGVIAREEKLIVGDGVVRGVDLLQENKTARLVIAPDANFGKVNAFKLSDPDRLVVDVSKLAAPVNQSIIGEAALAAEAVTVIPPSGGGFEFAAASAAVASSSAADVNIPDKMAVGAGRKIIVIDPGHGGKDPGGRKLFGLKEKELNLLLAKELYGLLKGEEIFDVVLTRNTDEFIPLADRSIIANNYKADIFISLHANASRDRREKGFEIYFMSEKASDPWAAEVADYENSVIGLEDGAGQGDSAAMLLHSLARNEYLNEGSHLAGLVTAEMEKRTPFVNRGVKQAAFYVLRGTYSPGILVEMGFMTNSFDQKNMNDKKIRAKTANALYKAIIKYAEMKKWK